MWSETERHHETPHFPTGSHRLRREVAALKAVLRGQRLKWSLEWPGADLLSDADGGMTDKFGITTGRIQGMATVYVVPDAPSKHGAEPTSAAAGHGVRHYATTLREEVLAVIAAAGPDGLTADHAARLLGASVLAVRPRVSELKRLGRIEATGERRRNASGMRAAVWRIR